MSTPRSTAAPSRPRVSASSTTPAAVRRRVTWLVAGTGALAVVCVLSVAIGSRSVPLPEVWRALGDPGAGGFAAEAVRLRVPRTVLGIVVGAALAVAGALMQGVSRNPLADPTLLGLNGGAVFAVVCGIAFVGLTSPAQYATAAFLGAALAAVTVWTIGSLGRSGATPLKLTLAGAVLGAVLSSLTAAVLLPRVDVISTFRFWQVGGIAGARFGSLATLAPVFVLGALLAAASARALNALALGDELARGLGGHVTRARALAGLAAVLLCACSVALAGPIGFVGLVVPHVARLLVGADHRWILAACTVLGPVLLLTADVIGRVVTRPDDIEVGIVMAVIGAPFFIALVRRRRFREV